MQLQYSIQFFFIFTLFPESAAMLQKQVAFVRDSWKLFQFNNGTALMHIHYNFDK